jgi:hypothetical protein
VFSSLLTIVKKVSNSMRTRGGSNMQNMCEYAIVGYKKADNFGPVIFNWKGKQSYLKGDFLSGMNVINNYEKPKRKLCVDGKILRVEEKSVEIYLEIFARFAKSGDLIYDGYAGGMSSAAAAIQLGMKWIGCEKDELTFKLAMNRLQVRYEMYKCWNKLNIGPQYWKTATLSENYNAENKVPADNLPIDIADLVLQGCSTEQILQYACENSLVEVKKTEIPGLEHDEGLFVAKGKTILSGEIISSYYGLILNEERYNNFHRDEAASHYNRIVKLTKTFKKKSYYINGEAFCPATYVNC